MSNTISKDEAVVYASQIEGRCNARERDNHPPKVVYASQIEGRCNRVPLFSCSRIVVYASQIEGRCNPNDLNA